MHKGRLILKRKSKDFNAGFCVLKGDLSHLLKYHNILNHAEQSYYDKLQFEKRKLSYLLGRITAKNAISELSGSPASSILIDSGIFNFPVVKNFADQNIQVCISHCNNIGIALAFPEEHPMGIDIEKVNIDRIDTFKTTMSNEEIELIDLHHELSLSLGYTIIWTAKESLSKIFRTGLTINFKLLEIELLEKNNFFYVSYFRNVSQYKAISFDLNGYICSIVIPQKTTIDLDFFFKILTAIFYDSNQNF